MKRKESVVIEEMIIEILEKATRQQSQETIPRPIPNKASPTEKYPKGFCLV